MGRNDAKREGFRLTAEGQKLASDFEGDYGDGNCSCHLHAPCGNCTHPGHRISLEENDEYWEPDDDADPVVQEITVKAPEPPPVCGFEVTENQICGAAAVYRHAQRPGIVRCEEHTPKDFHIRRVFWDHFSPPPTILVAAGDGVEERPNPANLGDKAAAVNALRTVGVRRMYCNHRKTEDSAPCGRVAVAWRRNNHSFLACSAHCGKETGDWEAIPSDVIDPPEKDAIAYHLPPAPPEPLGPTGPIRLGKMQVSESSAQRMAHLISTLGADWIVRMGAGDTRCPKCAGDSKSYGVTTSLFVCQSCGKQFYPDQLWSRQLTETNYPLPKLEPKPEPPLALAAGEQKRQEQITLEVAGRQMTMAELKERYLDAIRSNGEMAMKMMDQPAPPTIGMKGLLDAVGVSVMPRLGEIYGKQDPESDTLAAILLRELGPEWVVRLGSLDPKCPKCGVDAVRMGTSYPRDGMFHCEPCANTFSAPDLWEKQRMAVDKTIEKTKELAEEHGFRRGRESVKSAWQPMIPPEETEPAHQAQEGREVSSDPEKNTARAEADARHGMSYAMVPDPLTWQQRLGRWLFPDAQPVQIPKGIRAKDVIECETVFVMDWRDRLRALVSGRIYVKQRIATQHEVGNTHAVSLCAVLPPPALDRP